MARTPSYFSGLAQAPGAGFWGQIKFLPFLISPFRKIWCDPTNGSDFNDGSSLQKAFATLSAAYAAATAGMNDTIVLVGDGTSSGTARVDSAFTWAKNSTHLVGICAGQLFSQRARIAPTSSTTAFANFFTVSAEDCLFQNIQWFHDFATDTTNQIALTVSGGRNVFKNCHIAGIAKGDDAGGRSLLISGTSGENTFEDCVIGIDTVDRSTTNASVEFQGGCPRNVFRNCLFPFRATNSGVLGIKVAAASASDRFQVFDSCIFMNHNTTMTALCDLAASMGGYLLFNNPCLVRITGFGGDATDRDQIYVAGAVGNAGTSGLAVAPTA